MGPLVRLIGTCLRAAAYYIVPEIINYLARKLVSTLKKKDKTNA